MEFTSDVGIISAALSFHRINSSISYRLMSAGCLQKAELVKFYIYFEWDEIVDHLSLSAKSIACLKAAVLHVLPLITRARV